MSTRKGKAFLPTDPGNWWKDIPGMDGKYQANPDGQIRRVYKTGRVRLLTPFTRNNTETARRLKPLKTYVKISCGKNRGDVLVSKLIAKTFLGEAPPDKPLIYHKNGITFDNRASNLAFISRKELGQKSGGNTRKRRSVLKIDASGEAVAVYRSAREAGKENHMSYQTVLDRCHGKVKKPYALDGYNYIFEDPEKRGRKRKYQIESN